jgi:hypothetical protein
VWWQLTDCRPLSRHLVTLQSRNAYSRLRPGV